MKTTGQNDRYTNTCTQDKRGLSLFWGGFLLFVFMLCLLSDKHLRQRFWGKQCGRSENETLHTNETDNFDLNRFSMWFSKICAHKTLIKY